MPLENCRRFVARLQALHPTVVVLEATGGLERAAGAALATVAAVYASDGGRIDGSGLESARRLAVPHTAVAAAQAL